MNTLHQHKANYHTQEVMNNNKGKRVRRSSQNNKSSSKKEGLKVVYISTPMKVTTSASKFREIVQELTGRESDVVRIMETSGGADTWTVSDDHDHRYHKAAADDHHMMISSGGGGGGGGGATNSDDDDRVVLPFLLDHHHDGSSPSSSSEELVDHQQQQQNGGGVFLRGQDSNLGIFDHSTCLFYDHLFQHFDVLGSY